MTGLSIWVAEGFMMPKGRFSSQDYQKLNSINKNSIIEYTRYYDEVRQYVSNVNAEGRDYTAADWKVVKRIIAQYKNAELVAA